MSTAHLNAAAVLAVALAASCSFTSADKTPIARSTGFVEVDDGTAIYYERIGRGPALVFIHGLGGNFAVWYKQVPHFARERTVVTISQRGFAPSGGDRESYAVDRLVADLALVLDDLEIAEVDIVGQSMGGWTALGFALAHPQRVRSVVLADTVAGISNATIEAHYQAVVARAREVGERPPPLSVHPAIDPELSRTRPEQAYLYQALSAFGSPRPGAIALQLGETRFAAAALAANRAPTLFIVGERDRIFTPATVREAASLLPASRVRVVSDSGHSPYYERPRTWNRVVEDFLRE